MRVLWSAIFALALVGAPNVEADEFYSCRTPSGRIEMRDTPCPADSEKLEAQPGRVNVVPKPVRPAQPNPPIRGLATPHAARPPQGPHPVRDEPFVDPDWDAGFIERMLLRARFSGVLSSLHNLRNASMFFNAEQGSWPGRAEDMGLDGSNMQTREIADVWFLPDGTILAALKPGFGKGKFVAMRPVEELGGAQLGWRCAANFPAEFFAGSFGASCESRSIHGPASVPAAPEK